MTFEPGTRIRITSGDFTGAEGTIVSPRVRDDGTIAVLLDEGGYPWSFPTLTVGAVRALRCTVCGMAFDPDDPETHAIATGHHADVVRRVFS